MEILWNCTISAEFWAIFPKFSESCDFQQNLHIKNLGEILLFYEVLLAISSKNYIRKGKQLRTRLTLEDSHLEELTL